MADVFAEGGTESSAGMTWREQEYMRERQQDEEIAARVRAFNTAAARLPLPCFHRYIVSSRRLLIESVPFLPKRSFAHALVYAELWTGVLL